MESWKLTTADAAETAKLAATIANNLRGGECIELLGDLGAGKTTFVKGLALALSTEEATSPSFTINNRYAGKSLSVSHYDFYRLQEMGVLDEELKEDLSDKGVVTVVEWGEIAESVLPSNRLRIVLSPVSENSRSVEVTAPAELHYMMEGIKSDNT